jgi:PPE-repeat protein
MALIDADRQDLSRKWIQQMFANLGVTANLTYADVKAACDAFDAALDATVTSLAFVGTNTLLASLNNTLPAPFKTVATAAQKAVLLSYVLLKRGGVL